MQLIHRDTIIWKRQGALFQAVLNALCLWHDRTLADFPNKCKGVRSDLHHWACLQVPYWRHHQATQLRYCWWGLLQCHEGLPPSCSYTVNLRFNHTTSPQRGLWQTSQEHRHRVTMTSKWRTRDTEMCLEICVEIHFLEWFNPHLFGGFLE